MTSGTGPTAPLWVGTSWKMTKSLGEARDFARALAGAATPGRWDGVQPFVVPPATAISTVAAVLAGTPVVVGAQNAHWADEGAWTGEISVPQVADAGARLVELGHSERREHFAETDATVNAKVRAVLRHGLRPLVCVGEPASVRAAGGAVPFVTAQVTAALAGVPRSEDVLVAYEPVWAIGDGGRPATPEDVAPVCAALRAELGDQVPLLYGGSVHRGNALELLEVAGVGGLFVGRGAWDVRDLIALLDLAAGSRGR